MQALLLLRVAIPLLDRINGDTWLDLDYRALVNQPLGDDLAHPGWCPTLPSIRKGDFSCKRVEVLDTPALTFSGVGLYHPAAFAGLPCRATSWPPCCATGWRWDGWVAACWLASGATSAQWIGCASWTSNCSPAPINITRS